MFTNNDDTLNAGAKNAAQPKENPNNVKNNSNGTLKTVAAFAAGGVAGAGAAVGAGAAAAYAAGVFDPDEELEAQNVAPVNEEEPAATEEETVTAEEETMTAAQQAAQQAAAPAKEPEPAPKPEPAPEPRQDPNIHYASNHHTANAAEEPAFYRENEVRIESISTSEDEDGEVVHAATGTVNGHQAVFIDDGHGNVQGFAVDLNDNQELEDNEIFHGGHEGVTMGNLAEHMVENEVQVEAAPTPASSSEMQVIAVQNDVDMDGQTVDVAMVSVENTTAILVDVDQNGEVDLLSVDVNNDGDFSVEETEVVTDEHLSMPSSDDMTGTELASNSELPDYSNDEDITIYDV